ncbi:hypothetical protein J7E91_32905 [Streptomyces sp. ISL-99]|uniref:DUF6879 family protein n=1 Tax=Streptomyces sp. ISL-99 TaxID=2819193 RepID=UPI001BE76CE4|nr:DUF6879 family protein [Streptomyces sp. ISL-99]MBT2530030.1 hypothetical protein [Streptomyces sp. ISL-99]
MFLDGDEWRKFFDGFEREAFRFETQPKYTMPNEAASLASFLRGEPKPHDHNSRWHGRVRAYVESGKRIGRVRVVQQPLTDYQRYQLSWGIPGNVAAGEAIRILDLTVTELDLPTEQDWWMFDDARVVQLNYRPDGTQINREVVEGDLEPYRIWKRLALDAAIPYAEYAKDH